MFSRAAPAFFRRPLPPLFLIDRLYTLIYNVCMAMYVYADVMDVDRQMIDELSSMGIGLEYSYFTRPENFEGPRLEHGMSMLRYARESMEKPPIVHGPYMSMRLGARDPLVKEAVSARLLQCAKAVSLAGACGMVIHAAFDLPYYDDAMADGWASRASAHLEEIVSQSGGLDLYVENVREPEPDLMKKLLSAPGLDKVKICLDTGHINIFGKEREPLPWARALGKRLGMIHLNSNFGDADSHLSHTCGSQDYDGLFRAIDFEAGGIILVIEVRDRAELEKSLRDLRDRGICL